MIAKFDIAAMHAIIPFQRQPLILFFRLLTYTGTGKSWFIASVALNILHSKGFIFLGHQIEFLQAMPCALFAYLACLPIKSLVSRKRPPDAIPGYRALVINPNCGSFPSGHAAAAFAFFIALLVLNHPAAYAVGAWALLVSFSRYYLCVHFPTDILGGVVVGAACGLCVRLVQAMLTY